MTARYLVWSMLLELLTVLAASGAEPPPVKNPPAVKRTTDCFNCPTCGNTCTCFGGGYYCTPTSGCAAQRPLKAKDVMPKVLTYEELFARVQKGEKLVLAVGPYQLLYSPLDGKYNADGYTVSLSGIRTGIYDCFLMGGKPVMQARSDLGRAIPVPVRTAPEAVPPDSGVIPGPVVPARGQWVKVCNGNGTCRLIWVVTP